MAQSTFQQSMAAMANAPGQFYQSATSGLRKRNTIFSRSERRNTDGRATPTLPATMSSRSHTAPPETSRTSSSLARPDMDSSDRTHSESNSGKRHSLFGGRRISLRRESGREGLRTSSERPPSSYGMLLPKENFATENDYYRYLRKMTISPPFNFQHVTHTNRAHVVNLSTVDERDLSREFWAKSAHQTPRGQLNGIQADDVFDKLESMGVPRGAISSRPTTPAQPKSPTEPVGSLVGRASVQTGSDASLKHPRRLSSIKSPSQSDMKTEQAKLRMTAVSKAGLPIASQFVGPTSVHPSIYSTLEVVSETAEQTLHTTAQLQYRSKQPLPALPPPTTLSCRALRNSAYKRRFYLSSAVSLIPQIESGPSQRSSRNIHSAHAGMCSAPELRSQSAMSHNSSWEDDVEFCYEQEAEATCNFDWDAGDSTRSSFESDGGVRLSRFAPFGVGIRTSAAMSADLNGRSSKRESSMNVGYRGFQQARQSAIGSTSPLTSSPLVIQKTQVEQVPEEKESFCSTDAAVLPSIHATSLDYLSDPESSRCDSTRNCNASSYSSCDSMLRRTADARHSSVASMSSVPELMHSSKTSNTPETEEPDTPTQEQEMLRAQAPKPFSFDLMRRPSAMSNRAILQAGREVQRKRPNTPGRFSRLLSGRESARTQASGEEKVWI